MSFAASFRAEQFRLWRSRSNLLLLMLPASAGVLRVFGGMLADELEAQRRIAGGARALAVEASNGFGPLADALRTGGALLALLLLVLGATSLVRDRESGALAQWYLAAPRAVVVAARALSLAVFTLAAFAVLLVSCSLLTHALFGLGDLVEEGDVMATGAQLWIDVLKACGGALPALWTCGLLGLLVSSLASSTGGAVAGTLVPFVLFDLLRALLGDAERFVFVTFVPFLGDDSTLAHLTDIARAYSDADWLPNELMRAAAVPGVTGALLLLVTVLAARTRAA